PPPRRRRGPVRKQPEAADGLDGRHRPPLAVLEDDDAVAHAQTPRREPDVVERQRIASRCIVGPLAGAKRELAGEGAPVAHSRADAERIADQQPPKRALSDGDTVRRNPHSSVLKYSRWRRRTAANRSGRARSP